MRQREGKRRREIEGIEERSKKEEAEVKGKMATRRMTEKNEARRSRLN